MFNNFKRNNLPSQTASSSHSLPFLLHFFVTFSRSHSFPTFRLILLSFWWHLLVMTVRHNVASFHPVRHKCNNQCCGKAIDKIAVIVILNAHINNQFINHSLLMAFDQQRDCVQGLVEGRRVQICDCCVNRLWQHLPPRMLSESQAAPSWATEPRPVLKKRDWILNFA